MYRLITRFSEEGEGRPRGAFNHVLSEALTKRKEERTYSWGFKVQFFKRYSHRCHSSLTREARKSSSNCLPMLFVCTIASCIKTTIDIATKFAAGNESWFLM